MEDKELLELAAKACGLRDPSGDDDIWFDPEADHHVQWNPLEDDGDAFRLAVKLGIGIWQHMTNREVECEPYSGPEVVYEFFRDDQFAATRRAIVRAAAALSTQSVDNTVICDTPKTE